MTSAPAPLPPHITAEHRDRIERFVARARRIEAHSLLADRERLLRWSTGATFTTEPTTGKVSWDLPLEEQFESLAARVRPLTLPGEDISLPTVLGSLKAFVRGDYEKKNRIAGLRTMWEASRAPKAPVVLATLGPSGEPETTFEQAEIAERWLYGDLVHADEVPEGMAPIHMRPRWWLSRCWSWSAGGTMRGCSTSTRRYGIRLRPRRFPLASAGWRPSWGSESRRRWRAKLSRGRASRAGAPIRAPSLAKGELLAQRFAEVDGGDDHRVVGARHNQ